MKVLFLGDSITEGIPGVSYVSMIQDNCIDYELVNRGIGGDTVSSLFVRVKKMNDLSSFDQIVLFIGTNDVFGKLTNSYKILKILRRQRWTKDNSTFEKQYKDLINFIIIQNKKVIIIPPLLIGEDMNNCWNKELLDLINIIHDISIKKHLTYIDLYSDFNEYLKDKFISNFLPLKISELLKDMKRLTNTSLTDKKSKDRGLHLTLDGVHINSLGAEMISKSIIDYLRSQESF